MEQGHKGQQRVKVMGVINASPNSFYGATPNLNAALQLARQFVEEGADILDVGGEATNPNVNIHRDAPSIQAEIDRVAPLIERIKKEFAVAVSVDTSEPKVMQAAIAAGVDIINDQRALSRPGAKELVIAAKKSVVIMHNFEPIRTPGSSSPDALLQEIISGFQGITEELLAKGLTKEQIIIDPGFGQGNYGKNVKENYYILRHLQQLSALGFDVLAGWSRKSMIGDVIGKPPGERLFGSIAAAVLALEYGANILRVHDVAATVDAVKVWLAAR